MRYLLAAACASLSVARVFATPIAADFVDVEYSGKIYTSENSATGGCWCSFPLGASITGTLRIDLRNAPPDLYPGQPKFGAYRPPDGAFATLSFVSGFAPARQRSLDSVQVQDDFSGAGDLFSIGDFEQERVRDRNGDEIERTDSIFMTTYSLLNHVPDFITGDGLVQSFTLRGDNLGTGDIQSATQRFRDGNPIGPMLGGVAQFVIKTLTARPGVCRAP